MWKAAHRFGPSLLVAMTFIIMAVSLISPSPTAVFLPAKLDSGIASDALAIGRGHSSAIEAEEVVEEVADVMQQQQAVQSNVRDSRNVTVVNASDASASNQGGGLHTRDGGESAGETLKEQRTSQIPNGGELGDAFNSAHQISEVDDVATPSEEHRLVNDTFYGPNEFVGSSEPSDWLLKAEDKEVGGLLGGLVLPKY